MLNFQLRYARLTGFQLQTGNYTQRSRPKNLEQNCIPSAFHYGNANDDRIDNPHETIGTALKKKDTRPHTLGKCILEGIFLMRMELY